MGWRVWGEPLFTADFGGAPVRYMPIIFRNDGENFVLKAIKTWLIVYNNPSFTSFEMRIYSSRNSAPGDLLHTSSNVQTKASIHTLANACKEIYFDFNKPVFDKDDTYYLVLWGNGYTGDATAHVAWKKSYPDPNYTTGLSDTKSLGKWPYDIAVFGADL